MRSTFIAIPLSILATALTASSVLAKMPSPTDAEKAAAAEKTAKTAWQDKVDAYKLCMVQDKLAATYRGKSSQPMLPKSKEPTIASTTMTAPVAMPQGGVITPPTVEPRGGMVAPPPPMSTPPCVDPGQFAPTPVAAKPLEASGAHSPPGTATSPPSTNDHAADLPPKK